MNLAKCLRSLFSKQVVSTSRGLTSQKFFSIENNKRTEKLRGKLPLTNGNQMQIEVFINRKGTPEPIIFRADSGSSYT